MRSIIYTSVFIFVLSICVVHVENTWAMQKAPEANEKAEKKLKMKDLPTPVQETVQEQSKGATVRGISKEVEQGKTFYELETTVGSHSRDLLIDPSGKVVELEEEVDVASLPASVQAEVKKSLGSGKLLKFESVTKQGAAAGYEALVETSGRKSEIPMGLDGKTLPKEKK